jgi:hypothetical protein
VTLPGGDKSPGKSIDDAVEFAQSELEGFRRG